MKILEWKRSKAPSRKQILLASRATVFYWLYFVYPMCWKLYEENLLLHMHSKEVEWMHRQLNFPGYYRSPKDTETFCFSQVRSMTKSAWIFVVLKKRSENTYDRLANLLYQLLVSETNNWKRHFRTMCINYKVTFYLIPFSSWYSQNQE